MVLDVIVHGRTVAIDAAVRSLAAATGQVEVVITVVRVDRAWRCCRAV